MGSRRRMPVGRQASLSIVKPGVSLCSISMIGLGWESEATRPTQSHSAMLALVA